MTGANEIPRALLRRAAEGDQHALADLLTPFRSRLKRMVKIRLSKSATCSRRPGRRHPPRHRTRRGRPLFQHALSDELAMSARNCSTSACKDSGPVTTNLRRLRFPDVSDRGERPPGRFFYFTEGSP
jgi:hypothetical protein